jgi:hypothetical protein
MALRSQISAIVANQLGKAQGEIEARIQNEALELLSKFTNQCPDSKELIRITKIRNNLLRVINTFQKQANRLNSIPSKLRPPISVAKRIIKLLKRNPTKLAVGSRPSFSDFDKGGLYSAKTAGFTNTQADRLVQVTLLLEALEDDLSAVTDLVQSVQPSFDSMRNLLESLNTNIQTCAQELEDAEELKNILNSIQPLENTGSEGTPNQSYTYRAANGRDYILAIIEDRGVDSTIPRRVAVAKDNLGIIILRGQPSFSSDTQVLLDELKFRIDNQLP